MEDNFDKIFSDKIKDVIENNEIQYNPEHWNQLVAKKNKKKRKVILYWRIAGVLVLFLLAGGVGQFLLNISIGTGIDESPLIIKDKSNDSIRLDSLKRDLEILITTSEIDSVHSLKIVKEEIKVDSIIIRKPKKSSKIREINQMIIADKTEMKLNGIERQEIVGCNSIKDSLRFESEFSITNNVENEIVQNIILIEKDSISSESENNLADNKRQTLDSLLYEKQNLLSVIEDEKNIIKEKENVVKIGVNLSKNLNYNQNSSGSNKGLAGGISLEVPIFNKFDIYTGVLYSNQKFDVFEQTGTLNDNLNSGNGSQLKSKEIAVRGFEIPINLKYNFKINKNKLFTTIGISSTRYTNEILESNYLLSALVQSTFLDSSGNSVTSYEVQQTESKVSTSNNVTNFAFASSFNLSFGMEIPFNKKGQSIIIEPYLKYSLKPVSDYKIDYSSGGVFLRYNFSLIKK